MAEHRPTETLLILIQQALVAAPQGLAPRKLLDHLQSLGEDVSRPTMNRLLALGVERDLWSPQGAGRSVVYTAGQSVPLFTSSDTTPMSTTPENPPDSAAINDTSAVQEATEGAAPKSKKAPRAKTDKAVKAVKETKPASLHDQIRSVVWWVADTLRDKTGLQVEAYQPVTLAMTALKRNFDIQAEQLRAGGPMAKLLDTELPMLEGGLRDPKDVARALNGVNGFWDPTLIKGERFGLPLMTWPDLVNFKDSATSGKREDPYVMVLRANPAGHQTEETALFTYTTYAPDLKALILEIIDSMVPDLREAFGSIGIHSVMDSQSEHAATLSNSVLRYICTTEGTGGVARLVDFDLGLSAVSVDVFSDTYMDLLGRFAEDSGKRGGEYFTPTPLVQKGYRFPPMKAFAQQLADDPSFIMRIADPTAGSNTFLVKGHERLCEVSREMGLPEPQSRQLAFYAQELKNTQVGLGVFNMFYHGLASRLNPTEEEVYVGRRPEQGGIIARINGNSISDYTTKIGQQAGQIHLVVANPPYGTDDYGIAYALEARNHPGDARWSAGVPNRSEGEWPFVQTIVDLLAPTGFAMIVLPLGVLFRDGGSEYRQWLLEKDWIEGIVVAPSNQFLTTSIPVCLLLINKNKAPAARGGVFLINASEDFTKVGKFNNWDEDRSVAAWEARSEIPGYSGFVSIERLRKAIKYSLAVNRWFSPIKEKMALDPISLSKRVDEIRASVSSRGGWLDAVFNQAATVGGYSQDHIGECDSVDEASTCL